MKKSKPQRRLTSELPPFDDAKDNSLWDENEDPGDKWLPEHPGFITDLVYCLRGTKVPTAFCIWSAIFLLSTIVKREAWLDWKPLPPLFANFYVLLVAPPAVSGKGTIIRLISDVLRTFPEYLSNDNIRMMKRIRLVRNRGTKEFMMQELAPKMFKGGSRLLFQLDKQGRSTGAPLTDTEGRPLRYPKTSEAGIIAPELAVMLGRETYNEGLVAFLTDIYDTHDEWSVGTKTEGQVKLVRLFTTLLGGTQPDAFTDAMPKSASSGGFMSRCNIIFHDRPIRCRPRPIEIPGAPKIEDLAKRAAWIAEHTQGEHTLSAEADAYYTAWYQTYFKDLVDFPDMIPMKGRSDVMLLRLALLMKAQRYSSATVLEVEDLKAAAALLEATSRGLPHMIAMLGGGASYRKLLTVSRYIASHKDTTRLKLMQNTAKNISAQDVTAIVNDLSQRGVIDILLGERTIAQSAGRVSEIYHWTNKEEAP